MQTGKGHETTNERKRKRSEETSETALKKAKHGSSTVSSVKVYIYIGQTMIIKATPFLSLFVSTSLSKDISNSIYKEMDYC